MVKQPSARPPNLQREGVRGLFVLGIIATLVAGRGFLRVHFPYGVANFDVLVGLLILFWGVYAFLMAIAVSGDIFEKKVVRVCAYFARDQFRTGVLLVLFFALFFAFSIAFSYLLAAFVPTNSIWLAVAAGVPTIALMLIISFKIGGG